MPDERWFTIPEAAKAIGVDRQLVWNWIQARKVAAQRVKCKGAAAAGTNFTYRISGDEVSRVKAARKAGKRLQPLEGWA